MIARWLSSVSPPCQPRRNLWPKGDDSQELREWLENRGTQPVIPPRKKRKVQYEYDKTIYKQRNVIERMFCRFKDWRCIAMLYERNIKNFMAVVALAATVI